jgi:murein L,D-transpeptidase YafK
MNWHEELPSWQAPVPSTSGSRSAPLAGRPRLRHARRVGYGVRGLILALLLATGAQATALVLADHVLVEKKEHRLALLRGTQVLKTYRVALGGGGLAPKRQQGDGRVPEGEYRIDGRNAGSAYHRSLHVSYPNDVDRSRARTMGVATGGDIMIHGIKNGWGWLGRQHLDRDWTLGCIAVTDPEIEQIWSLVPNGTRVTIVP